MSREKKFTVGPWKVGDHANLANAITADVNGRKRVVATYQEAMPDDCTYSEEAKNAKANGQLLAAAPEMLKALEGIAMYFHSRNAVEVERATLLKDHGEVKAMFAAIAKAYGEHK